MKEHRWLYEASRVPLRLFTRFVARLEVEGLEHIPARGPVILVANHTASMDILAIAVECPRLQHHMAKVELFGVPLLGWYIRKLGAFPVRRGESDREALRTAAEVLAAGQMLVVFPEGHRSGTGRLAAGQPGVALIAMRSGAPILPVGITGTARIFKGLGYGPWAPRVRVVYGEPFTLESGAGRRRRADLDQATATIMGRIAALLPPASRGIYAGATAAPVLAHAAGDVVSTDGPSAATPAPAAPTQSDDARTPPAGLE